MRPLIDVATLQRGYDLPVQHRRDGQVPVFAANGPVAFHDEAKVPGPGVVTGRSGTIGRVHYVADKFWPLNTSLFVKDFHGNHPRYIYYLLREMGLERYHEGSGVPTLNRNVVHLVEVPVPPVPEQRRIAAILDQADVIRANRRQILTHLDALTQSIFHDMFGTETVRAAIGDFADVRTGSTPSREDADNYGGSVPWVKTGEVKGTITATEECVTEKGMAASRLRLFPAGSVIVAMYGQGRTRGRSALLGVAATTNQACAVIPPNGSFDPVFLQAQLAVEYDRLRGNAEGGNQPNLSVGRLQKFEVALPPLSDQHQFAERVGQVNTHRAVVQRALETDGELFASLQSRAFKGEL